MKTFEYPRRHPAGNKYSLIKGIITTLLALLYAYAAFSKLFDFQQFRTAMLIQPFPRWAAEILVFFIPSAELLTVILLAGKRTERIGYWFSLALMAEFTGYVSLALAGFWNTAACSCGGILGHLSWMPHLFFNLFFLIVTIVGIAIIHKERREVDIK
jgi:putative oxidoreductase